MKAPHHLAPRIYEGGAPQGAGGGIKRLPQSKIKDFCQPPRKRGGQGFYLTTHINDHLHIPANNWIYYTNIRSRFPVPKKK